MIIKATIYLPALADADVYSKELDIDTEGLTEDEAADAAAEAVEEWAANNIDLGWVIL